MPDAADIRTPRQLAAEAGFFGKVPSQGDFVAGRFHRPLRDLLDRWLQKAFEHERRVRGDAWRPSFARMPFWRFALGAEAAGGTPVMGVMAPSSDRVGRVFPFFLVSRLPGYRGPTRALCGESRWFEEAEKLLRATAASGFTVAAFERGMAALPHLSVVQKAYQALPPEAERSFWWTEERRAEGRRFAAFGLPAPDSFGRFLGGDAASTASPSAAAPLPLPVRTAPKTHLVARAGAFSHPGTRLRINAGRTTDPALAHLHALCDGQGEGSGGAQAAELAVDRLSRIEPAERLFDLVANAKGALGSANTLLRTAGPLALADAAEPSSTAVAVLLSCRGDFAVLWAGDARVYLLRDGLMRLLTRDHVEVGLRRRLSRSVGGSAQFAPDSISDAIQPGDRFLLASSSLPRTVPERLIAARMAELPIDTLAETLVQESLVAGASDNVSAFAVEFASGGVP